MRHFLSFPIRFRNSDNSQLQQMIMAETTEEDRRAAALRFAVGHPLRIERLQLRHEKEREEKRALISWIRRDIEVGFIALLTLVK